MIYLLLAVSAVLTALSMNISSLFFLAWFSLAPFIYVVIKLTDNACKIRKAYFIGFFWSFIYYFFIYHWFIYLYPMEFAGLAPVEAAGLIVICWVGLSLLQTIGTAFTVPLFRAVRKHRLLSPLLFACVWTLFEWLQTLTWAGVPWARLAVSQASFLPAIQSASLLGSLFISFLIVLVNGCIALAFICFSERKKAANTAAFDIHVFFKGKTVLPAHRLFSIIAASVFLANILFGVISLVNPKSDESRALEVAVIQGNISSNDKWNVSSSDSLDIYVELSEKAFAEADKTPEIFLWPESVINSYLAGNIRMTNKVKALAEKTGAIIFVGTFEYDESFNEYNAVVAYFPDGSVESLPYYKQHLVPFGEYMPMADILTKLLPMLGNMNLLGSDLAAGEESRVLETEYGSFGRLICFDSIYEELARQSVVDGAEIILISTNDSWYNDSAAVYQHNSHAVLRAVENGRWVVRAANTGISSLISSEGEITTFLPPLTDGFTTGTVYMKSERTLYSYVGDIIVVVSALIIIAEAGYNIYERLCAYRRKNKLTSVN